MQTKAIVFFRSNIMLKRVILMCRLTEVAPAQLKIRLVFCGHIQDIADIG
ncbi:Uncharacterised protein [Vibrio cholerae]|nr:Uncharacterised protein [Vibrio cholerae]CSC76085.1 Uncharacterised protein [Vibrio cholerae]CSD20300.1 Uncharacterised protein [Vibrio cholerae]CSD88917.1 Uncharacterised protein [Vibrio cholerae]CSI25698.1 Uncharacterised protein [Vibrio cholerae]